MYRAEDLVRWLESTILHKKEGEKGAGAGCRRRGGPGHCNLQIRQQGAHGMSCGMCGDQSSINLSLIVVSMICEPLIGQPMNECIELNAQLVGIELADWAEKGSRLEVDILIGADYYWRFVTEEVLR